MYELFIINYSPPGIICNSKYVDWLIMKQCDVMKKVIRNEISRQQFTNNSLGNSHTVTLTYTEHKHKTHVSKFSRLFLTIQSYVLRTQHGFSQAYFHVSNNFSVGSSSRSNKCDCNVTLTACLRDSAIYARDEMLYWFAAWDHQNDAVNIREHKVRKTKFKDYLGLRV